MILLQNRCLKEGKDLDVLLTHFVQICWCSWPHSWYCLMIHVSLIIYKAASFTCAKCWNYFVSVGIGFCLQHSNLVWSRFFVLLVCTSQSSPQTCHLTSPVIRSHLVGSIINAKLVAAHPGSTIQSKTCVKAPAASCMNWFLTTYQIRLSNSVSSSWFPSRHWIVLIQTQYYRVFDSAKSIKTKFCGNAGLMYQIIKVMISRADVKEPWTESSTWWWYFGWPSCSGSGNLLQSGMGWPSFTVGHLLVGPWERRWDISEL